jgi:hypothetical protein
VDLDTGGQQQQDPRCRLGSQCGQHSDAYDNPAANGSVAFAITSSNQSQNGPLKVTSLTADRTAPQIVGTAVTFTRRRPAV